LRCADPPDMNLLGAALKERIPLVNIPTSSDLGNQAPSFVRKLMSLGRRIARRSRRAVSTPSGHAKWQILARLESLETLTRELAVKVDMAHEKGDAAHEKGDEAHFMSENLERRMDDVEISLEHTQTFHWDYVALVRRLASIEDRLLAQSDPVNDAQPEASIPLPGLDYVARKSAKAG
jgi:hypothetical protein